MGNPIIYSNQYDSRLENQTGNDIEGIVNITSDNIAKMIEKFEHYYLENSVYKCIFICETDDEVYRMAKELHKNNYTVSCLYYDEIYDERDRYLNFKDDMNRVFIISYLTWYTLNSEIKVYLLPCQNLIALGSIGETGNKCIKNWILDAKLSGFIEGTPRILELYDCYEEKY